MIPLILGFLGSYIVAEAYKKYASPTQKKKWQNFAKMHHGEAGAVMTAVGVVARSPTLVGTGIGLMLHDSKDSSNWFKL